VELGEILFKTGQVEASEQAYRRALVVFPGYHRAHAGVGMLLAGKGDLTGAIEHFRTAQAAVPFPEYAGMLEALYRETGNVREADRQRAQIDAIDRLAQATGEKANRTLAIIYADANRRLERALELAKGEFEVRADVYSYDALAWVLFRLGNIEEAIEASAQAIRFGTPEPAFYFHAGMISSAAGQAEHATKYLTRALELNPNFNWTESRVAREQLAKLKRPSSVR
jgi:tetratricopeptide (TPR) repeat protein